MATVLHYGLLRQLEMNVLNLWPLRAWRRVLSWIPVSGWSRRTRSIWMGDSLKAGERPEDLRFAFDVLPGTGEGRVLIVAISGFYPPGSAGNDHAEVMRNLATDKIDEVRPAAVLFDLSGLDYVWGDSICCLEIPALRHHIPCSIYATGRTATALDGLFRFLKPKVKIFREREEAIACLRDSSGGAPSNIH